MRPINYDLGAYAAGAVGVVAADQLIVAGTPLALVGGSPFVNDVPRTVQLTFGVGPVQAAIADDGGSFTDETTEANNAAGGDMMLLPPAPVANDRYYFAADAPYGSMDLNVGVAGTGTYTIVWEYFDRVVGAFLTLSGVSDGTDSFKIGGTNTVSFTIPSNWGTTTLNNQGPFFYIRAELQAGTVTGVPRGTQAFIGGDASGNRFLIRGSGPKGNEIYDAVDGAFATAESRAIFSSILSITPENNLGGNVSADTVTVVPSPWFPLDSFVLDFRAGIALSVPTVGATPTVEVTQDQLGYNDAVPERGVWHGSLFDIKPPIENIDDISGEFTPAIATDTVSRLELTEPATAIRFLSNEVLTGSEVLRLQIQQGTRWAGIV